MDFCLLFVFWTNFFILPFDRTTENLSFSAFIKGRNPKYIETKIIGRKEQNKLYSFEIGVLVASHFILLPDFMYAKYSCNRNKSLIK